MITSPGYWWSLVPSTKLRHQFPTGHHVDADAEGRLTAICGQLVDVSDIDPDSLDGEHCPDCLIHAGSHLADDLEAASAQVATTHYQVALTEDELDLYDQQDQA